MFACTTHPIRTKQRPRCQRRSLASLLSRSAAYPSSSMASSYGNARPVVGVCQRSTITRRSGRGTASVANAGSVTPQVLCERATRIGPVTRSGGRWLTRALAIPKSSVVANGTRRKRGLGRNARRHGISSTARSSAATSCALRVAVSVARSGGYTPTIRTTRAHSSLSGFAPSVTGSAIASGRWVWCLSFRVLTGRAA